MQKKLTVTIDEEVYEGLREVIGPRKISRFIEDLVRPHVTKKDIYAAYKEMAADEVRESEALEWAEEWTKLIACATDEKFVKRYEEIAKKAEETLKSD